MVSEMLRRVEKNYVNLKRGNVLNLSPNLVTVLQKQIWGRWGWGEPLLSVQLPPPHSTLTATPGSVTNGRVWIWPSPPPLH